MMCGVRMNIWRLMRWLALALFCDMNIPVNVVQHHRVPEGCQYL